MQFSRLILAFLCLLPGAHAASVTFFNALCTAPISTLTSASRSASTLITCPQFDPSLGLLTEVSAFYVGAWANSGSAITLQNDTGSSQTIPGTIGFEMLVGPLPGGSTTRTGPNFLFLPSGGTLAPGASQTVIPSPPPLGASPITDGTTNLALFIGTGSIQVPAFVNATLTTPTLTVTDFTVKIQPFLSTMVYGYVPVPEPSTFAAAASALAFAAVRRRLSTKR